MNLYKPDKCYNGYTLFCHSYEDPRASESGKGHIYLIDMEGADTLHPNVAHEWTTQTAQQSFCRLLPDGNLLYPTRDRSKIEEAGLRELDPDSNVDIIGVIDRDTGHIVWAWGPGELDGQHKPHMLPNGNILIFDNGTLRGYSRVIELDPLTGEIEWEYTADPKETFLSRYISGAQRLPNGNTLICEGAKGHLFEVTPEKEVVWDYVSPFKEEGAFSSIYRCLRYSPEYVKPLLGKK